MTSQPPMKHSHKRTIAQQLVFTAALILLSAQGALAHGPASGESNPERHIEFPDTADYQTLVLDLHTHSVFSDGHVWPTVRVSEALRDGLHGMAITEHLEFQPHLADIPNPDRNRAFEEARRAASGHPLIVIPGVEITRVDAPGHINAVFVQDANPLVKLATAEDDLPTAEFETRKEAVAFTAEQSNMFNGAHSVEVDGRTVWRPYPDAETYDVIRNFGHASTKDPKAVLQAANEQGAFVFWNHPSFERPDSPMNSFHLEATAEGLLHGVEIANGDAYYPNAHRLAMKHDLALIGVSDVHELIAWDYKPDAEHNPGHRPVTLVLATESSTEGMKEALFARRTIVWWKDVLIGRQPHLDALLQASLSIESVERTPWAIRVNIRNVSDAPFKLVEQSGAPLTGQTGLIEIAANATTGITMNGANPNAPITLTFDVLNALVAPDTPARITLTNQ